MSEFSEYHRRTDLEDALPQHPEAVQAKRIDVDNRLASFTDAVYKNHGMLDQKDLAAIHRHAVGAVQPEGLTLLYGDVHGHSNYSDGKIDPEEEIRLMRERVDFCVLTDHDHGGIDHDTLYGEKWTKLQKMAAAACEPGKFSALVGYERDSYPWYDNMIIYFGDHMHPMLSCEVPGETNAEELAEWLARDDVFIAPHDTTSLTCSTDFTRRPKELMPHGFEMISRGDCAEYFDHPLNVFSSVRGGSYRDALKAGAHAGVVAGADSHDGTGGIDLPKLGFPKRYPGMTGIWAKENTPAAIFEAMKARHTFVYMGPERPLIRFTVNDGMMGDIVSERIVNGHAAQRIGWHIESRIGVAKVAVIKNGEPYYVCHEESALDCTFTDYIREESEDSYYLQITFEDGRMAWTSPCWVQSRADG